MTYKQMIRRSYSIKEKLFGAVVAALPEDLSMSGLIRYLFRSWLDGRVDGPFQPANKEVDL